MNHAPLKTERARFQVFHFCSEKETGRFLANEGREHHVGYVLCSQPGQQSVAYR